MAYKVQPVDLKAEVYKLICKERYISSCSADQLLKELKEAGVKCEGDSSYEQLSQVLCQLIQEGKVWIRVRNVKVCEPGIEFESVEKVKQGMEEHFGKNTVAKTVMLVKKNLGKDFWSHELHFGERADYLNDVRWGRNMPWLQTPRKK